jgi:hypothetical protein
MHPLKQIFAERLLTNIRRSSIYTCSRWAEEYRVLGQPIPGKWTFKFRPWLEAFHNTKAPLNIVQKAAQVGFTEAALNISFYVIDVLGKDVLYVLPAKSPEASDFSASRFDAALELSPYLTNLFSDVKNVGHKRAGSRNLYIRGSRSRGGLKSIPVYMIVFDEVDEMDQENIPLALERTKGQTSFMNLMLSTPTVDGEGINKRFKRSTQNHFFFRCPSCSRFIELKFPESLIVTSDDPEDERINDSHYICTDCKQKIVHELKCDYLAKNEWVPQQTNFEDVGWHVNRMYATLPAGNPIMIAKSYLRSLLDPAEEQEFYNSTLGLPHTVKGAQVTQYDIEECMTIAPYQKYDHNPHPGRVITMGIDQGAWCHYEIDSWSFGHGSDISNQSIPQLLAEGKVKDFEELDEIFYRFGVNFAVIDAHPERRKATEFANRHKGQVRLCFYPEGLSTKQIHTSDSGYEPSVSVDRTTWLDTSLGRFRNHRILLPTNLSYEYREHIKALVRVYEKDKNGNSIGRYRRGSKDDHLAHARNYSEIALNLVRSGGPVKNVSNIF